MPSELLTERTRHDARADHQRPADAQHACRRRSSPPPSRRSASPQADPEVRCRRPARRRRALLRRRQRPGPGRAPRRRRGGATAHARPPAPLDRDDGRAIRSRSSPRSKARRPAPASALALACDLVVAASDARFVMSHAKLGLSPDGGATARLAEALPPALVKRLLWLAEPVTAATLARARPGRDRQPARQRRSPTR